MTMWYEDDDFWRENYEVMFSDEAFRRATEDVDRLLSLIGTPPRQVMDLCCGPGRHAIPLAQRGIEVTAVDLSPFLLDKARENARIAGVSVEFVHSDMRRFARLNAFDAVLNLYTSFGYFPSREDDNRVLANIYASLRPGGVVVIDVVGKELQGRRGDRITDLPDGSTCIQRIQISDEWSMLDSEWILIRHDCARRYRFAHRLYSGFELRQAMEHVGFRVVLFGDLAGTPYAADSLRLIAIGRRPALA
jgi:SAM-dependent methyltransferase